MIKTLQKKFIFSAMLSVTILLILLLSAINIGNAYVSMRQNKQMTDNLLSGEAAMQPPRKQELRGLLRAPMDENSKKAAVYFTVRTDSAGNIIEVDISRISDFSEEAAEEICKKIIKEGLSEGRTKNFYFKTAECNHNERMYLFLDATVQIHNVRRVLLLSVLIGFVCWTAMLLLVILLSKKAIRPVAENIERQKQFVTDAGHEIKTPLAIILSNTEAMELYNGENKWSKNIKEQVIRLNGLMQNLLTLAKADENNITTEKETVSLSNLTENIINMFSENAALKNITVERNIEPSVNCYINNESFSRLISILMDNAVKYSNENGSINVNLHRENKNVFLEISNTCNELPQCPENRLFDRFYRADSARTQKNGGYGIGLSAAKSIAQAHNASICAEYKENNVIAFKVKI